MAKTLKGRLGRLVVIFAGATALHAQVGGGTFTGEVRDTSGAVVPAANISITSVATGVVTTYKTSNEGVYFSPALIPGNYTISAEKEGFKKQIFGPVRVDVAQTVRVDLVLMVGALNQTMEVKATGAQVLQTESGDISQVIGSQAISQLPLNGRSYLQLAYSNSSVTPPSPGATGSENSFHVQGQRAPGNLFIVDGVSTTPSVPGRGNSLTVPLEAVQEFSLQMNSYSAEYGNVIGGVFNVQMKSGTNNWHGSAFEFLRNDKFDARNFFSNKLNLPKNTLRYNQFGGSVGGPIKRDKSFFFADYEGTRTRTGAPILTSVPTGAMRGGDFSNYRDAAGAVIPIFDPTSDVSGAGPGAPALRSQYSGNVIPPSKINPAAAAMLVAMPLPNQFDAFGNPLSFNNFARNTAASDVADSADGRYDYNFSTGSTLFARYSYRRTQGVQPTTFGDPLQGGGGLSNTTTHNIAVGHTYTFRPNLINQFRFGSSRLNAATLQAGYGKNTAQSFGIPNVNVSPATTGLPTIVIAGQTTFGDPIVRPLITNTTMWVLSDKLNWTFGRHTLRLGVDYTREAIDLTLLILSRGLFQFEPNMTSNRGQGGSAWASFVSGYPTAVLRDTPGHPLESFPRYGVYVQDDFKATSRLTLNLGLHYDLMPPSIEKNNRQANFNPVTRAMFIPGQGNPYGRRMKMTDYRNFAPRLGMAYALSSDRKTVVRAGYAIGFMDTQGSVGAANGAEFNPPFYVRNTTSQFPLGVPSYALTGTLPSLVIPDIDRPSGDLRYLPVRDRNPYSQTWNFGIQRSITDTLFSEVAYVGSRGVKLLAPVNINQGPPAPAAAGSATARRPFGPAIGEIRAVQYAGSSSYNGLVVKTEKRFSQGLLFLGSYAWSKSLDNQSTGLDNSSAVGNQAQDPNNLRAEWGHSTFDVPHRLVFSAVWEIPYGRGRRFGADAARLLDWAIGGWQLSGIYTAQSGTWLTATMLFSDINADTGANVRPDAIGPANLPKEHRTLSRWFDTAVFVKPSTNRYGNAGRNTIQGPGLQGTDIGISKSFKWGADAAKRIQFRAEMFNSLNHTNPGNPVNAINSPAFGAINSAGSARVIQFGLRFEF